MLTHPVHQHPSCPASRTLATWQVAIVTGHVARGRQHVARDHQEAAFLGYLASYTPFLFIASALSNLTNHA